MEKGLARPGGQQALIFHFLNYPLVTASHKGTAAEKLGLPGPRDRIPPLTHNLHNVLLDSIFPAIVMSLLVF